MKWVGLGWGGAMSYNKIGNAAELWEYKYIITKKWIQKKLLNLFLYVDGQTGVCKTEWRCRRRREMFGNSKKWTLIEADANLNWSPRISLMMSPFLDFGRVEADKSKKKYGSHRIWIFNFTLKGSQECVWGGGKVNCFAKRRDAFGMAGLICLRLLHCLKQNV